MRMGMNVLLPTDKIIAIEMGWQSSYPANEAPAKCIDGDPNTKYLNFGEENSGIIVTPAIGASMLDSFQITTANDSPERDPVVWMVYGTNDAIVTLDNGDGTTENWTLICGGTLALPAERLDGRTGVHHRQPGRGVYVVQGAVPDREGRGESQLDADRRDPVVRHRRCAGAGGGTERRAAAVSPGRTVGTENATATARSRSAVRASRIT